MEFMLVKFNQNMFLFFKKQLLIPKHGWHKCVSNYQSSPRLQESSSQRAMPKFPLKSPWLPRKLAARKCQRLNQIEICLIHSWFLVLLKIGPQSPVSIFDVRWNSIDCLVAKFPLLNVVTVYWITLMLSILAFPAFASTKMPITQLIVSRFKFWIARNLRVCKARLAIFSDLENRPKTQTCVVNKYRSFSLRYLPAHPR